MKIYFTGSVKGGREYQPYFEFIVQELQKYGTVFGQHVSFENLPEHGETHLSDKDILERERGYIDSADIVVGEASGTSVGVGYLLSYASSKDKKVVVLHHKSGAEVSSIIKGDTNINLIEYEGQNDINQKIGVLFS